MAATVLRRPWTQNNKNRLCSHLLAKIPFSPFCYNVLLAKGTQGLVLNARKSREPERNLNIGVCCLSAALALPDNSVVRGKGARQYFKLHGQNSGRAASC